MNIYSHHMKEASMSGAIFVEDGLVSSVRLDVVLVKLLDVLCVLSL